MLYSIFTLLLGAILGGLGVRLARRNAGFHAASRGRPMAGTYATGGVVRDKDDGQRIIGRLLMLVGVLTIICSVFRLVGLLI